MLTTTLWDRCFFLLQDTFGFSYLKEKEKVAVCVFKITPGGTRTHNLQIRSLSPYPLGHGGVKGASLEDFFSSAGFEPATAGISFELYAILYNPALYQLS